MFEGFLPDRVLSIGEFDREEGLEELFVDFLEIFKAFASKSWLMEFVEMKSFEVDFLEEVLVGGG